MKKTHKTQKKEILEAHKVLEIIENTMPSYQLQENLHSEEEFSHLVKQEQSIQQKIFKFQSTIEKIKKEIQVLNNCCGSLQLKIEDERKRIEDERKKIEDEKKISKIKNSHLNSRSFPISPQEMTKQLEVLEKACKDVVSLQENVTQRFSLIIFELTKIQETLSLIFEAIQNFISSMEKNSTNFVAEDFYRKILPFL